MAEIIDQIIATLRFATQKMEKPAAAQVVERYGQDPFLVLMSCILSLRTKDTVSLPASLRLFEQGKTPLGILAIPVLTIQDLIYPVGFYRRKAAVIHQICNVIIDKHAGQVPRSVDDLLALPGVGRKTANLVLGEGFGIPALCVDTHVHRISNRLGIVKTKTPECTEEALKKILPQHYWIEYNQLIVMWGQNVCVPVSPKCSQCPIYTWCQRVGVTVHR